MADLMLLNLYFMMYEMKVTCSIQVWAEAWKRYSWHSRGRQETLTPPQPLKRGAARPFTVPLSNALHGCM